MAGRRRKNINTKSLTGVIAIVLVLISVVIGRNNMTFNEAATTGYADAAAKLSDTVQVHFIDVGQGSSTLVQCGNSGILIDAGEREYGDDVVSYLKSAGVERLIYVVASHPHSDHIGGMLDVLNSFPVDNIIMPKLTEKNMPTTRLYEKFMELILDKQINVIEAKYAKTYSVGAASMQILGPLRQVTDLNNMSVVCRVKANTSTFMITGDAEKQEMSTIYDKGANLKCDVMTMGHHGSRTSLDLDFLGAVDADVAIISCGKDNSYGHPHEETLTYLETNKIKYYRTDRSGSIVFNCDAEGYTIN